MSKLYVVPVSGGPWTRITDNNHWDDKPRWSPDGRTVYFVSRRGGFFNVGPVGLSLTQDKLVLTLEEQSGSIWVLDNVDR